MVLTRRPQPGFWWYWDRSAAATYNPVYLAGGLRFFQVVRAMALLAHPTSATRPDDSELERSWRYKQPGEAIRRDLDAHCYCSIDAIGCE